MNKKSLLYLTILLLFAGCRKDEEKTLPPQTITIVSNGDSDGHIINSTPKTIKNAEKSLDMGWNGGSAMRAFLSFDLSGIIDNNKVLVIDKAVLKVYEKNTNMMPFDGEGVTRVVETYLLNYETLDAADFDMATIANCGVMTNWGYSVLKEYALNVSESVAGYIEKNTTATKLQFRLQFTHNDNLLSSLSPLNVAMWRIYAGDDQGTTYNKYRPVMEITYHLANK